MSLERADSPRRIRWWSLVGLALLPLLVAGGFLWATWDSNLRLDRVSAAVVNDDDPVKLNGQLVPLGRQLAGGLVSSDEDNFSWQLTDDADAADGLASGRYAAVVRIPHDFSARATSYAGDADTVRPATIDVQTSQISGIADPVVGQAITLAATKALNTQLTEQYLTNVYLGFNTTKKQFGTLADAADKLSDGTDQLSGGLARTATGSGDLADGLTRLSAGAGQLATGTGSLADGTRQLADGLDQLADGTAQSAGGGRKLAGGLDQLADGTAQSAAGGRELARGAIQLADNAGTLSDGADQLARGLRALHSGTKAQPGGTTAYAAGAGQFADGLHTYRDQIDGFGRLSDAQLAGVVPCPTQLPEDQCPAFYAGLRAGTAVAVQGLADQGDRPGLLSGADQLASGAERIDGGVASLASGAGTYATGVQQFAGGTRQLATGTDRLADGLGQLATGTRKSADGAGRLAGGLGQLATGTRKSADGAGQLADGAGALSTGADQLAAGTRLSADGAGQLSGGLVKLADGGESLADGSKKFSDGIAEGQDKIPTYSAADRDRLSATVAAPVTTPQARPEFADIATTTYLAVIALWLGGLASFLVLRAVSARALSSMRPSWSLALRSLLPAAVVAAVQAAVLTAVLQGLLDLSAAHVVRLLPLALLTGVTFAALNQALVAWFGGTGRFVSVAVVVSAAAAAITSAVPAAFDAITPFLPLTPALHAFRAVASDGPGGPGSAALLLAWLAVGVAASVLAVARRRMVPALTAAPVRA